MDVDPTRARNRRRRRRGWLWLGLALLAAPALAAQEPEPDPPARDTARAGPDTARPAGQASAALVGQVVSASTGRPLDGAVVSMVGTGMGSVTDSAGNFRIPRTRAGADTVEVRFIGFRPSRTELELEPGVTTRVVFLLSPTVVRVAELTVEIPRDRMAGKLRGFEQRRRAGFGYFFTLEDILRRNPRLTSDLLREVPGVRVGPIRQGRAEVTMGRGRDCKPALFLDGVPMPGLEVDDIPKEDLGAVEVYRGANDTPGEFQRLNTCGAVVIWTPEGFPG